VLKWDALAYVLNCLALYRPNHPWLRRFFQKTSLLFRVLAALFPGVMIFVPRPPLNSFCGLRHYPLLPLLLLSSFPRRFFWSDSSPPPTIAAGGYSALSKFWERCASLSLTDSFFGVAALSVLIATLHSPFFFLSGVHAFPSFARSQHPGAPFLCGEAEADQRENSPSVLSRQKASLFFPNEYPFHL